MQFKLSDPNWKSVYNRSISDSVVPFGTLESGLAHLRYRITHSDVTIDETTPDILKEVSSRLRERGVWASVFVA